MPCGTGPLVTATKILTTSTLLPEHYHCDHPEYAELDGNAYQYDELLGTVRHESITELIDDELDEILRSEPPEGLCQFYFCGLFVGVYRYLAELLAEHHSYDERQFWRQVRRAVSSYRARFPELEGRFETFDLLQPEFTKLCLDRYRLTQEGYGDRAGRPHAAEHGTVRNALYEVAPGPDEEAEREESMSADTPAVDD